MHGGGILDKGRLWEADLICLVMIADLLAADDDSRTAGADFSGGGGKGWKAAKYLRSLPVSRTLYPLTYQLVLSNSWHSLCIRYEIH